MAKSDILESLVKSFGKGKGPISSGLFESLLSSEGDSGLAEAFQSATQGVGGRTDTSTLDKLQMAGDVVGAVDPTPTVDLINAAVSGYRAFKEPERRQEHLRNVAISTVSGMVPYLGDTAKLLKYGKFSKAAKGTAADTAKMADIPPVISDAGESPFAQLEAVEPPSQVPVSQSPDNPPGYVPQQSENPPDFQEFIRETTENPPVGVPESPVSDAGGGGRPNVPELPTGGGDDKGPPRPPGGGNQPVPPMSSDFMVDLIQGFGAGAIAGGGLGMLRPEPFQSSGNSRGFLGTFGTPQQEAITSEAGEMAGGFWDDFKTMANPLSSSIDKLKAAFDGLWKVTIELPGAIEDWGESLKESQRHLTRFHAGVAGTFARSEIRGVMRSMESGERTAGSTEGIVEALDDLKDTTQPIKDVVTNIYNILGTTIVRLMTLQLSSATKAAILMDRITGASTVLGDINTVLEMISGKMDKNTLKDSRAAWMMDAIRDEKLTRDPGRRRAKGKGMSGK